MLPLKDEVRATFNETAAQEFFNQTEGLPYGYHNFMFGWLDTPEMNNPPIIASHFMGVLWNIVQSVDKDLSDMMFTESLNFHMGTKNLTIVELAAQASRKNMTLENVISVVEEDFWVYSGETPRDGYSYVCSAFVTALYKAGGVFGENTVQAVEFGPKDVYQLNIFNDKAERPEVCIKADPSLPYCQIGGKYRIELPGFSTIAPYNNMNENCPSMAPEYFRPDGC